MNIETSCGFIAFTKIDEVNYYLLIKAHNGDIGFPKGHMELGESEIKTALRETKEETGIDVRAIGGFRKQIEYPLKKKNATKRVIYFLGQCVSNDLNRQISEIAEVFYASYSDALKLITFRETKELLIDAENFLNTRKL